MTEFPVPTWIESLRPVWNVLAISCRESDGLNISWTKFDQATYSFLFNLYPSFKLIKIDSNYERDQVYNLLLLGWAPLVSLGRLRSSQIFAKPTQYFVTYDLASLLAMQQLSFCWTGCKIMQGRQSYGQFSPHHVIEPPIFLSCSRETGHSGISPRALMASPHQSPLHFERHKKFYKPIISFCCFFFYRSNLVL